MYMLANFPAIANAALPEVCFKSKIDHEVYLKYGDEYPPYPISDERNPMSDEEYELAESYFHHGPAKRKSISISVKQTQAGPGQMIHANASGSSTPSGSKTFSWTSNSGSSTYSSSAEYSTNPGVSKGAYSNVTLNVGDPVCGITESTRVQMVNQY